MYEYLGNDEYEITMIMYLDCKNGSSQALAMDGEAQIAVFKNSDKTIVKNIRVRASDSNYVRNYNYSCLKQQPDACVQRRVFKTKVTLPDIPRGYTIAYQRCCRNVSIVNLYDQETTGATFWANIPERKRYGNNSSPVFKRLPPNFLCLGQPLIFKHFATDKDGDSLVYELCKPFDGASDIDPRPLVPADPPYYPIRFNNGNGYSVSNMLTGNPGLKINSATGLLTATPTRQGQYVVGICVKEYRNGVYLGSTVRDFQLNVENCAFDVVSAFTTPTQRCELEVDFDNKSRGAISYSWDFGDPTTTADKSSASSPKYKYPVEGNYTISLIAKSTSCADTFYRDIFIPHDSEAYAGPDVAICPGQSARIGVSWKYPGSSIRWTPSTYLSSSTVPNPFASPVSSTTYSVRKTFDFCYTEDEVEVRVGPPEPEFDYELIEECRRLVAEFKNNSQYATSYEWDFGTGDPNDTSTAENPFFQYEKGGKYVVTVKATLNNRCSEEFEKELLIEIDTSGFAGWDRDICFGDSVLIGVPTTIQDAKFSWTPKKYVKPSNFPMVWAKPEETTEFVVTRTVPECAITDTVVITVDKPDPFLKLAYTAPCDGLNIKAYNASKNVDHLKWDFGIPWTEKDTSSSMDSIRFTYPSSGNYVITLKGTSPAGCEHIYTHELNVFADTAEFAGPDSNLCKGQWFTLGVNDSVSFAKYKWTPGNVLSSDTVPNPIIKADQPITLVLLKSYPECDFLDTVKLDVWNPLASFTSDYDPHCDALKFEAKNKSTGSDRYLWDFDHEAGRFYSDKPVVTTTFPKPGEYKVSLFAQKGHCSDTITRLVKVYIDTGAFVIPDTVICLADSVQLGRVDTAAKAIHVWSPPNGLSATNVSNPKANPGETTVYIYERRFPKCSYFDTVSVRLAVPIAEFDTVITPVCDGFQVELTNLSDGAKSYTWEFSNGNVVDAEDAIQVFDFGTTFWARLISKDAHCADSFQVSNSLRPFDDFEVLRPNVFSPNGDGINDCFTIEIPELPECHGFEIYVANRWGQPVFIKEVDDNEYCWDGRDSRNDKELASGTYFYIISVKGRRFNGTITLVH